MAKYYTRLWGKDLSEVNARKGVAQPVWYAYRDIVEDGAEIDFADERRLFKVGDEVMFVPFSDDGELVLGSAEIKTVAEDGSVEGPAGRAMIVKVFKDKLDQEGKEAIVPVTKEMLLADQASEDKPLRNLGIVSPGWWRWSLHMNEEDYPVHIRAELLVSVKNFDNADQAGDIGADDVVAAVADSSSFGNLGDDDDSGITLGGDDEP